MSRQKFTVSYGCPIEIISYIEDDENWAYTTGYLEHCKKEALLLLEKTYQENKEYILNRKEKNIK